jgi:hypothetical protein
MAGATKEGRGQDYSLKPARLERVYDNQRLA